MDSNSGSAFTQFPDGNFAGQQFDIETGAGIGGPIADGRSFTGLEYVGSTLYGTVLFGPGSASELRTLDPSTGAWTSIGLTGFGPISGLAYDEATGVMYGITGGPGPAQLLTIDLATGTATVVGPAGFQAGSLEFGPDGALYGGGTGSSAGLLFRINTATGEGTSVGSTGFSSVTGLTLFDQRDRDWYSISAGAGDALVIETRTPAERPRRVRQRARPGDPPLRRGGGPRRRGRQRRRRPERVAVLPVRVGRRLLCPSRGRGRDAGEYTLSVGNEAGTSA